MRLSAPRHPFVSYDIVVSPPPLPPLSSFPEPNQRLFYFFVFLLSTNSTLRFTVKQALATSHTRDGEPRGQESTHTSWVVLDRGQLGPRTEALCGIEEPRLCGRDETHDQRAVFCAFVVVVSQYRCNWGRWVDTHRALDLPAIWDFSRLSFWKSQAKRCS